MDNESRAACYVLLAQGLASPQPGFAEAMLGQLLDALVASEGSRALASELSDVAAGLKDAQSVPLDQLQGEHTGLFINNHPRVPCPPYESAYREKSLMGNATASAASTYREWGLEVNSEYADHAGAELEFMAFVIRLSARDESTDTLPVQRAFLRDHLLTWMPTFASDIQRSSEIDLYTSLGKLLAAFLSLERTSLQVDVTDGNSESAPVVQPQAVSQP
jgi:putative dimethyl sulfoxide reductase chaperone